MTVIELIQYWEEAKSSILNPGNLSWEDLGFDSKPEEYDTVDQCLEAEGEFDEGQQKSLSLIKEFLEDLKGIK